MIRTIKTKQFKITALVLALVLTVSCVMWNTTKVHAQELEINNTSVQTFAGSRAIENGKLVGTAEGNATMSVFIRGSGSKYNGTNIKWTHDGSGWDSETDVFYEGANSQQQIYACSPYVDGNTGIFTVIASEQIDWLVATSKELTSSNVNLKMTHALTKLVINPSTFGSEVDNTSIAKIEVGGMYASGALKISDNSWSNLGTANATLEVKNNELLVIPMENCTSFPITFTMEDGRTFTTTVNLATVNNKLEAGTQYNIDLQVGQDKVTIGSITASPWAYAAGGVLETE